MAEPSYEELKARLAELEKQSPGRETPFLGHVSFLFCMPFPQAESSVGANHAPALFPLATFKSDPLV